MTDFPGIAGTDPLELLRFIKALNERLRAKYINKDALAHAFLPYFRIHEAYYNQPQDVYDALRYILGERPFRLLQKEEYLKHLNDQELYPFPAPYPFPMNLACSVSDHVTERADVRLLKDVLTRLGGLPFVMSLPALALWANCDDLTRLLPPLPCV